MESIRRKANFSRVSWSRSTRARAKSEPSSMLKTLVDRSPDLARLVTEGFDLEVRDGNLLVHHVPYVTEAGAVDYGILVSELTTNGEATIAPGRHEVWLVGPIPYDHQGNKVAIIADEDRLDYGGELV